MALVHKMSLFFLTSNAILVMMNPNENGESQEKPLEFSQSEPGNFNERLQNCFAKHSYSTMECMGRSALTELQSWNEDDCLDFGNVKLDRNAGESRDILDLDWDPKDFGNVVRAASRMLERRNLRWDLGSVYPGLQMRVGPTLSAANGMIEFALDERAASYHQNRQLGAGRLLMRQLILPFLLGFKFNLASLLPLVFGLLIIITKKALILSKIAIFVAGLLGWNSLMSGFQGPQNYIPNGYPNINLNQGYGLEPHQYDDGLGATILQNPNLHYQPYRRGQDSMGFPFGQHVIREIVNVYDSGNHQDLGDTGTDRREKNYVWKRNKS
ncbi:hypothetical protein QAD02_020141 [Eretmocerus hayati]|uniref:Uncharacterized protein n=1 Tax=Eretmocerus hayati TaxID=131215 RepID=A0ACC2PP33_9HYME|nr:hypothetical protein QAD02_020141 [Eretmocerus hayati]